MTLTLEITSTAAGLSEAPTRQVFTENGGTVGRAAANTWVLNHSEVSGTHAIVTFRNGVFYIRDVSRNGVAVLSRANRLPHNGPYPLKAGDRIFIGPYEISVLIDGDDKRSPDNPSPAVDPFEASAEGPVTAPASTAGDLTGGREIDPLQLFEPRSRLNDSFGPPPRSSPTPQLPAPGGIPDDYNPLTPEDSFPHPSPTGYHKPEPPDLVRCSVFLPPTAKAGHDVMVQVFAHLASQAEIVSSLAGQFDRRSRLRGSTPLDPSPEVGTRLSFHLIMRDLDIAEPVQHLTWLRQPDGVEFAVHIPAKRRTRDVIGTVLVSHDNVPFGHVKFILHVTGPEARARGTVPERRAKQAWKRYQHAFISYASEDRAEVMKRVQMLPRVNLAFFQDLVSLDPGQRWERSLYKEIDHSDVFFLFWSTAARNSEWVLREVQYALQKQGGDEAAPPEIIPIIIEGPPPVPPPASLAHLHFSDQFIYFINPVRQGAAP